MPFTPAHAVRSSIQIKLELLHSFSRTSRVRDIIEPFIQKMGLFWGDGNITKVNPNPVCIITINRRSGTIISRLKGRAVARCN